MTDNQYDHIRGSKNKQARLDEGKVRTIKDELTKGVSLGKIAARYGVSKVCIHNISKGKTWTHVQGPELVLTMDP